MPRQSLQDVSTFGDAFLHCYRCSSAMWHPSTHTSSLVGSMSVFGGAFVLQA
jgi:hypothetical protein